MSLAFHVQCAEWPLAPARGAASQAGCASSLWSPDIAERSGLGLRDLRVLGPIAGPGTRFTYRHLKSSCGAWRSQWVGTSKERAGDGEAHGLQELLNCCLL